MHPQQRSTHIGKQGVHIILKGRAKWVYVVLFTHHLPKYYQTLELYLSMVFKHSTWIWLQKSTWYHLTLPLQSMSLVPCIGVYLLWSINSATLPLTLPLQSILLIVSEFHGNPGNKWNRIPRKMSPSCSMAWRSELFIFQSSGWRPSTGKSSFRCAVAFVEEIQKIVITRIPYDSVHHVGICIAIAMSLANYELGTNIRSSAEWLAHGAHKSGLPICRSVSVNCDAIATRDARSLIGKQGTNVLVRGLVHFPLKQYPHQRPTSRESSICMWRGRPTLGLRHRGRLLFGLRFGLGLGTGTITSAFVILAR
jgi:hypothetical protein